MKNNSVVADIVANQRKLERKRWFVILSFLVIGVITEGHTTRRNARLIVGSLLKNGNETPAFLSTSVKACKRIE